MRSFVAAGSNLGDRAAHLALARARLEAADGVRVVAASGVFDTPPLGPPQPRYLNAVLALETDLSARALLELLGRIEAEAGRVRDGPRWGPRTLDLDLLLHGEERHAEPDLVVPHPGLATRRFVLAPLAELAPDLVVPGVGRTVAELLAASAPDDAAPVGGHPIRGQPRE